MQPAENTVTVNTVTANTVTANTVTANTVAGNTISARQRLGYAFLTALLCWLPLQRSGLFPLGWLALLPLLWALQGLERRARMRLGFLTAFLIYALTNWWILPTVTRASPVIEMPPLLGAGLGTFSILFIASVHGLQGLLLGAIWDTRGPLARHQLWALPVAAAVVWSAFDVLRCVSPLAHCWGALAYTQWRDPALLQSAALFGQHGLTALCVWFAACLAAWLIFRREYAGQPSLLASLRTVWLPPLAALVVLHGWGAWRLAQSPGKRALRVLLIQTNVPSLRKNFEGSAESPFNQAYRLTTETAKAGQQDLIVWPETTAHVTEMESLPVMGETVAGSSYSGLQYEMLATLSRRLQTPILAGSHVECDGKLYNEALLIRPDGSAGGIGKQRMVPFGERAPFGDWLPWLRRFAPNPPVDPAPEAPLLTLRKDGGPKFGAAICFESSFPWPARAAGRRGAALVCVLTNDEWFAGTTAPWEHAAMATVRAAENGIAVVQSANGGYSFAVDRRGQFVLNSSLQTLTSSSIPTRYGEPLAIAATVPLE